MEEKWIKRFSLFIIGCLSFITALLTAAIIQKILDLGDKKGWDPLAFTGAIIGGGITWLGVKKTLLLQRNERLLKSYSSELSAIYKALDKLIAIKQYQVFLFRDKINQDITDIEKDFKQLDNFVKAMDSAFPELLGIIDWAVYDAITEKKKGLLTRFLATSMIKAIKEFDPEQQAKLPPVFKTDVAYNYRRLNELFWEINYLALSIYKDLEEHKKNVADRYYILK